MKWKGNCNHVDIYSSCSIIIPNTDRDLDTNRMQNNATKEMTSVAQNQKEWTNTKKKKAEKRKIDTMNTRLMNIANYAAKLNTTKNKT